MKALIVEDEIFSANHLQYIIQDIGVEVVDIVDNSQDALKICKEQKVDIVLMDIMIKGSVSGVETAVEIEHNISKDILIIFLTAYSDAEMIDYATRSNAFAYLLKPYRKGEIIATIKLAEAKLKRKVPIKEISNKIEVALVDGYIFNLESSKLFKESKEVAISQNTKKLLLLLCKNRNIYIDSKEIINYIWEDDAATDRLRSLIYRLKQITKTNLIKNRNNIGYRVNLKT